MLKEDLICSLDTGKHRFTPKEIATAIKNKVCLGCGLCCITFHYTAPISRDLIDSTFEKKALGPCPHMQETADGILCTLHDLKDHTSMAVCRAFHCWDTNASNPEFKQFATDRERMYYAFFLSLITEGTEEDISMAEKLILRGILQGPVDIFSNLLEPEIAKFLKLCLSIKPLPRKTLYCTDIDKWASNKPKSVLFGFISQLGINVFNPTDEEEEFCREFLIDLEELRDFSPFKEEED
jgi:hypothetical protein